MANRVALLPQITITSSNKWIDFTKTVIGAPTSYSAEIAAGTYDDSIALAAAAQSAMLAENPAGGWTVGVGIDGKVTIDTSTSPDSWSLDWDSGAHSGSSAGEILGFDVSADDTAVGGAAIVSDYQHQYGWYTDTQPAEDTFDRHIVIGGETFVSTDGTAERYTWGEYQERRLLFQWQPIEKIFADDADTNEDFETFWKECAYGTYFSYYRISTAGAWTDEGQYALRLGANENLLQTLTRNSASLAYYSFTLNMVRQGS